MTSLISSIPFGYCHCGCNQLTPISPRTRGKRGTLKGQPVRFISGHNATRRPIIEYAEPFRIEGVYCRLIQLTQGQYTIVDESDYEWLMQWRWQAKRTSKGNFYACRSMRKKGDVLYISMHRQILGLTKLDPEVGDHINPCNTLDNRRDNLRPANWEQSQANRRIGKNNTTGCKGLVQLPNGKWRVRIYVGGASIELGTYALKEDAIKAYREGCIKYHGEFAYIG